MTPTLDDEAAQIVADVVLSAPDEPDPRPSPEPLKDGASTAGPA